MRKLKYIFLSVFIALFSLMVTANSRNGNTGQTCVVGKSSTILIEDKTDDQIMEQLFQNSYQFYQKLRHSNGVYFDMVKLEGTTDRGSVASIGMGLMSLCVGHEMGWEPNAEAMVLQTLKTVLEGTDEFYLQRNALGCFIHFYDINTGAARGSNYSPIDSDLLLGGALFAKRYFNKNSEIADLVDKLFNSVDHSVFVGDVTKGQIALSMNLNGTPSGSWTIPFNEYMIVAWFAKNQSTDPNSPANQLWQNHYSSPDNMKHCVYPGNGGTNFPVLSPSYARFTSMFTFMFNHNFVHPFSTEEVYKKEMLNAMKADSAWWDDRKELEAFGKKSYEWGTGAGVGGPNSKYQVDRICLPQNVGTSKDQNQNRNVSPHILAGFSPVAPKRVRHDILAMYKDPRNIGKVELETGKPILWKYSYSDLNWKPDKVEGVDFSCMVFGLAALPQFLGPEFFQVYNDFFNPEKPVYKRVSSINSIHKKNKINVWPNPSNDILFVDGNQISGMLKLEIYNLNGCLVKQVFSKEYSSLIRLNIGSLKSGSYVISAFQKNGDSFFGKFVKL